MTRGRKPLPVEQHLQNDSYREDRHGGSGFNPERPPKPVWLSPQAGVLWDQEFEALCGHWVLYRTDSYLIGQFFEACAVAILARKSMYCEDPDEESITLHGAVIGKPNNFTGELELKKHPGITAWKDAVSLMKGIAADIERRGAQEKPADNDSSDDAPPPVARST